MKNPLRSREGGDERASLLEVFLKPVDDSRVSKIEQKPEGPGGAGAERDDSEGAEVGGRGRRRSLYICWNDAAQNYVDPSWKWFQCWQCGSVVYLN